MTNDQTAEEADYRNRVRRARRKASSLGYTMRASRTQEPRAVDYGHFYMADARTNYLEFTGHLDDVEAFLSDDS